MVESRELTADEELAQIRQFKHQIMVRLSGNYPPLNQSQNGDIFPEIRGESSNRGNKLLQNSESVTYSKLRIKEHAAKVFYNGAEHKMLSRKRLKFDSSASYEDEDDLNEIVDVKSILSPISSLKDVVSHPSHSKTFRNPVLRELALNNVLMVEKEQENVINYSKLLEIFLGDFPDALYEDRLKLPEYDHQLTFKEEEEGESDLDSEKNKQQKRKRKNDGDEEAFFSLPHFADSETLLSLIPKQFHTGDPTSPISTEITDDIETTRQLAQIALQRNQEFIRNLQKIRNCIIKANRIKERILMWGKEFAGVSEEDITVPNALHVVKRGLISATTNQAQPLDEDESEAEE